MREGKKDEFVNSTWMGGNWDICTWGFVLDESGTVEEMYFRKVANRKKIASKIKPLVYSRNLLLERVRMQHEVLLEYPMMYENEKLVLREK